MLLRGQVKQSSILTLLVVVDVVVVCPLAVVGAGVVVVARANSAAVLFTELH